MSLKLGWASALLAVCFTAAAWADGPIEVGTACGPEGCTTGGCATGNCGGWGHCCCPKYVFTIEKPPRIKYKCICPKPICEPCNLEGYGYFPTCWRPWAYPPNYGYCPAPPPGVVASAAPPLIVGAPGPAAPGGPADEPLPPPKKTANPNPDR